MGLILDTSYLIDAERRGLRVKEMLVEVLRGGSQAIAVSAISLTELAHGATRAKSERGARIREGFLTDVRTAVPVIPVGQEIAVRAGRLDGLLKKGGVTIGVSDAVIAATALELRYGVVTLNGKHFRVVPGLDVVEL